MSLKKTSDMMWNPRKDFRSVGNQHHVRLPGGDVGMWAKLLPLGVLLVSPENQVLPEVVSKHVCLQLDKWNLAIQPPATITTPVFPVVPSIGVWAGFFPLEFKWCVALMIVYPGLQSLLIMGLPPVCKHHHARLPGGAQSSACGPASGPWSSTGERNELASW